MLYGDQSVYKGELPYRPTDIRMGLREIRITGARCGEKLLSVYGENFTKSSSVCLERRVLLYGVRFAHGAAGCGRRAGGRSDHRAAGQRGHFGQPGPSR